jgi:uncharacterized membrane protein
MTSAVVGQIVGYFYSSTGKHSFVDTGGIFTTFDDPSAYPSGTAAVGINDRGQIVGSFVDSTGLRGFVDTGENLHTEKLSLIAQSPLLGFGYAVNEGGSISFPRSSLTASCLLGVLNLRSEFVKKEKKWQTKRKKISHLHHLVCQRMSSRKSTSKMSAEVSCHAPPRMKRTAGPTVN